MSKAFIDLLDQFIRELQVAFPNDESINRWKTIFDATKEVAPDAVVQAFVKGITPMADQIMARDSAVFSSDSRLMKDLNMEALWATPNLSDNTKDCIWQYLQGLYMLGSNVAPVSNETDTTTTTVAAGFDIGAAMPAGLDIGAAMNMVQGIDPAAVQDLMKGVDMDAAMKLVQGLDIQGIMSGQGDITQIAQSLDPTAVQDLMKGVDVDAAMKLVQGLDLSALIPK